MTLRGHPQLLAGGLAVMIHALFLGALMLGVSWRSAPMPPVVADLWSQLPEPAVPVTQEPDPIPEQLPPVTENPDIAIKTPPQKIEKPRPLSKPLPEKKSPKQKVEKKLDRQQQRRNEALKAAEQEIQQALNEQLAAESRQLQKRRQMESASLSARAMMVRDYQDRIRLKIRSYLRVPEGMHGNPEVVYRVTLLPNGELNRVILEHGSGQSNYDAAVERAIQKASPFPLPPDREAAAGFRDGLILRFKPTEAD